MEDWRAGLGTHVAGDGNAYSASEALREQIQGLLTICSRNRKWPLTLICIAQRAAFCIFVVGFRVRVVDFDARQVLGKRAVGMLLLPPSC